MIKLNKQVDSLYKVLEKIDTKLEILRAKQEAIEDKSTYFERDMTRCEQERYNALEDEIDNLLYEYHEIENALDFLKDFTDY